MLPFYAFLLVYFLMIYLFWYIYYHIRSTSLYFLSTPSLWYISLRYINYDIFTNTSVPSRYDASFPRLSCHIFPYDIFIMIHILTHPFHFVMLSFYAFLMIYLLWYIYHPIRSISLCFPCPSLWSVSVRAKGTRYRKMQNRNSETSQTCRGGQQQQQQQQQQRQAGVARRWPGIRPSRNASEV